MLVEVKRIDKQEKTVVSSLDVANTFGKRHDNVLKDIRELGCSEEFRLLNFEESKYLNEQKHKQPMYYLTRDGFTLLVMGYTGETAMKFKEAYIKLQCNGTYFTRETNRKGKRYCGSAISHKGITAVYRK